MNERAAVRIEPWAEGDLPILEQTLGDPQMTKYLGGPESHEKLVERQEKYERLADSGEGRMFKIIDIDTGEAVGSVGYWDKDWGEEPVYEIGWMVMPAFQGRGIASAATAQTIAAAASDAKHRYVHAFPSVENASSNAICRKLGFTLLGEHEFEYPPGSFMQCNDWRFDLSADGA
jgi:RimJ/RimL family protein N-acetyltransferase